MNENVLIISSNLLLGVIVFGVWGFSLYIIYKDSLSKNKHLYASIFSILWAAIIFAWATQGIELMNTATVETEGDKLIKSGILRTFSVWVYAFPAFVTSVGANLFTNFIIEKTTAKG